MVKAADGWVQRSLIGYCDSAALWAFDCLARSRDLSTLAVYRSALADKSSRCDGRMKRIFVLEDSDMSDVTDLLAGVWLLMSGIAVVMDLVLLEFGVVGLMQAAVLSPASALPFAMFIVHGVWDNVRIRAEPRDRWDSFYSVGNPTLLLFWLPISIINFWILFFVHRQ